MYTITVCMGSSCFSKGNAAAAEIAGGFVEKRGLADTITVKGSLCCGACGKGPNLLVNDKLVSQVSPQTLEEVLCRELGIAP
jgi:NADH:ubiquinone oxidoreductase subunit E